MKLLLFDIDGTLIRSAGAGRQAMNLAFQKTYGFGNGFSDIKMMGRTDPGILKDALKKHNLRWEKDKVESFRQTYFSILKIEIKKPHPDKKLCPGVKPLLDKLNNAADVILGLLTGNWKESAYIKLGYFDIDHYFTIGAFSDDADRREDLVPMAIDRTSKMKNARVDPDSVYVIGDTPLDIQSAKPHGVRTVAVATGFHSMDSLIAENPDYVFENFIKTEEVLSIFGKH